MKASNDTSVVTLRSFAEVQARRRLGEISDTLATLQAERETIWTLFPEMRLGRPPAAARVAAERAAKVVGAEAALRREWTERQRSASTTKRKTPSSAAERRTHKASHSGTPVRPSKPHWTQTAAGKTKMRERMLAEHRRRRAAAGVKSAPSRPNWTPEARKAASDRMKKLHATKRAAGLSWKSGATIETARAQLAAQRAEAKRARRARGLADAPEATPRLRDLNGAIVPDGQAAATVQLPMEG